MPAAFSAFGVCGREIGTAHGQEESKLAFMIPHLCPGVIPRFVDDNGDLLGSPLRHLDFRYGAAANLGGGAAEEGPLELDGLAMGSAAVSRYVIAARVVRCDVVVPARKGVWQSVSGGLVDRRDSPMRRLDGGRFGTTAKPLGMFILGKQSRSAVRGDE